METPHSLDPAALQRQQDHLSLLPASAWQILFQLTQAIDLTGINPPYGWNSSLSAVHQQLYDLGIIFPFAWQDWVEGRRMVNDPATDFTQLSPLEASMMLTAICRSDRFSEGTLLQAFLEGKVQRLVGCFRLLAGN